MLGVITPKHTLSHLAAGGSMESGSRGRPYTVSAALSPGLSLVAAHLTVQCGDPVGLIRVLGGLLGGSRGSKDRA